MSIDMLFLGRLFPREKEQEIKSKMKTGLQDAANALQWNLIDGMEENNVGKIKIINYLPVDAYPNGYTDKFIEGYTFQHTDKYQADDINVRCCNVFGIKRFINIFYFKKNIKKWAKETSADKKVLFSYTANSMFLTLAKLAKKINPEIEVACLIADIPEYSTTNTLTGFKKMYHEYEIKKCDTLYGVVDRYVLLTKHMAKRLGIKAPFIVMEGIATKPEEVTSDDATENLGKYILYTGLLNKKFGIPTLLDAFCQMEDKSVKLVLCGSGDAEDYIREKQAENPNIIFKGRVDRSEALALQKKAAILVNPRQNNEDFTKYSFPSKNLEYLSSGVPTVAYKLDGIPDEYDDYIIYPRDDSPETLCDVLTALSEKSDDERKDLGEKAKHFVTETKNKTQQSKRIVEFLEL